VEDLYKKGAKVYHRHQVCNRLKKKASEHKILLHSDTNTRDHNNCHNKSFIATRLLSPRESFNCEPSDMRRNEDEKEELFVINQEVSNTEA
jgi:hypothetical protein